MPKFRVNLKSSIPVSAEIEAADETEARAQFCEDLIDCAEQAEMECEPVDESEARKADGLRRN